MLLQGRYYLVQVLSVEGFGQTYLAQDTHRSGHPACVVKHLKPSSNNPESLPALRRLFTTEVKALEKLGSYDRVPHLVDRFEQDQEFYLVQDFIEGHSLSAQLQIDPPWSEQQVVELLQEVLGILEVVHSHGLIHCDIKPSNLIRRQQDGRIVLINFESVKHVWTQVVTNQGQTHTNFAVGIPTTIAIGTPGYMPVEQERGRPSPNSDIYALGMIGIQALTGLHPAQLPKDAKSGEIIWQHQVQRPELAGVLNKMVLYHFQARYRTATEALQALKPIADLYSQTQQLNVSGRMRKAVEKLVLESKPEVRETPPCNGGASSDFVKVDSVHPRRALVLDGLSNSKTTLALSQVLRGAGGFELEYWPQPEKMWSEVRDAIQTCLSWCHVQKMHNACTCVGGSVAAVQGLASLQPITCSTHIACQGHSAESHSILVGESPNHLISTTEKATVLLYLRGAIEETPDGEGWLVLGDNVRLSRSWLRQELRRFEMAEQIVVLDCPGASSLEDWVEELKLGSQQGQCLLAAAAPAGDPEQFTRGLLETLVGAEQKVGFPVANWIAKLQVKLGRIGIPLYVWQSGLGETVPPSVLFGEQYSRLEQMLSELVGPIAPTLLRQVSAPASNPQAWVEKLARYLSPQQQIELDKLSNSLGQASIAKPQTKSSIIPSEQYQTLPESFVHECKQVLTDLVGPIANFLIQKALTQDPQISPPKLVEILAQEIPNRTKAAEFRERLGGEGERG